MNFKEVEGMVGRWLAQLADYDFIIEHRAGTSHTNADSLSRLAEIPRRKCGRPECLECPEAIKQLKAANAPPFPQPEQEIEVKESPSEAVEASAEEVVIEKLETERREIETDGEVLGIVDLVGSADVARSDSKAVQSVLPVEQSNDSAPASPDSGSDGSEPASPNWMGSWSRAELSEFQLKDPDLGIVHKWILEGTRKPSKQELLEYSAAVRALCSFWSQLKIEDGILYREWRADYANGEVISQMIVPLKLRREMFYNLHESKVGGHMGITKTVQKVRARYYWPGCKSDLQRWCQECSTCAQIKPGPGYKAKLHQIPVGAPMDRIGIDVVGELPETEKGNKVILVVSDYFTKWVEAYAMPDQTAQTTADMLAREWISRFGVPSQIHTDQGRNFESGLFTELCRVLGINKTRTTPYAPWSDGLVERFNRTLQTMLKGVVNEERNDWDEHIPYALMAYRSTPQQSTNSSPCKLLFGREMSLPIHLMVGAPRALQRQYACETEYVEWLQQVIQHAHEYARIRLKIAARRQKNYHDANVRPFVYRAGMFVWRWYPPKGKGKLSKGWTGPFRIMSLPSDVNCVIQFSPSTKPIRVHSDSLKPSRGPIPATWVGFQTSTDSELSMSSDTSSERAHPAVRAKTNQGGDASKHVPTSPESSSSGDKSSDSEAEGSKPSVLAEKSLVDSPPRSDNVHARKGRRVRRPPKRLDW
jgi:hypothetical protein